LNDVGIRFINGNISPCSANSSKQNSYIGALEYELTLRGHMIDREVSVPVYYKGKLVARQRLDMVVDDRVIVECKATERLPACAGAQLIGYLRATRLQVGVLLHFGPNPKFYRSSTLRNDRGMGTSLPLKVKENSRHSRPQSPGPYSRE